MKKQIKEYMRDIFGHFPQDLDQLAEFIEGFLASQPVVTDEENNDNSSNPGPETSKISIDFPVAKHGDIVIIGDKEFVLNEVKQGMQTNSDELVDNDYRKTAIAILKSIDTTKLIKSELSTASSDFINAAIDFINAAISIIEQALKEKGENK